MKVFISWSGTRGKEIGTVLHKHLPMMLHPVKPYFSPHDIAKGARWSTEIAKELEASSIGLIVITPGAQDANWLLFEAGALSQKFDSARVCPLLFDGLEPSDLTGPLAQFQVAAFSKEQWWDVIRMVNSELRDAALDSELLNRVFEKEWPELEKAIRELPTAREVPVPQRTEKEMLAETLELVREQSRVGLREVIESSMSEILQLIRSQNLASEDLVQKADLQLSRAYRFKALGLIDLRERMDTDIEMEVGDAVREIKILQTWIPDFHVILHQLESSVRKGCWVRLLLLDPSSDFTSIRSSEIGFPAKEDVADLINANIRDLENLRKEKPELFEKIELRLYDATPVISLYARDDTYTLGVFWRGRKAVQGPQFIIKGADTPIAKTIDSHFEGIWKSAATRCVDLSGESSQSTKNHTEGHDGANSNENHQ